MDRKAYGVDPVDPYSKVVTGGEMVFVKTQIGGDPSGNYSEDVAVQTKCALTHIEEALVVVGCTFNDVLKLNVYLADIDRDFDRMDSAYLEAFADRGITQLPARTTVGTPLSWPVLLIQIDAVAVTP